MTDPAGNSSLGTATLSISPTGNILTVGPGKQYSTIAAAIAASHNGDTIQVQAGTYVNDFATINDDITLEGVGGMVNMVSTVKQISNGKAILITNGNDTINNFSFSGARVTSANGAGIRYQAGNLVLNNDAFFNNQDGLLAAANTAGSITINDSEFADNGVSDPHSQGYGQTHNLYVGGTVVTKPGDYYRRGRRQYLCQHEPDGQRKYHPQRPVGRRGGRGQKRHDGDGTDQQRSVLRVER